MALRMNLFGCRIDAVTKAIGSKDTKILDSAASYVSDAFDDSTIRECSLAWLRTLIEKGYPLLSDRTPPCVADDGGLLVCHLETEIHVFALNSIVRAIAEDDWLDLALESSNWHYSAISQLYNDLAACGFTRSSQCPMKLFSWIDALNSGTPLFGDDFRTQWSFYSFLKNEDLGDLIGVLKNAQAYERVVPDDVPDDMREAMCLRLSEDGRVFAAELSLWFGKIYEADQDAYILWS